MNKHVKFQCGLYFCFNSMFGTQDTLVFAPTFLDAPDNPIPDHDEVESNEEPQHSSYIRHQGEGVFLSVGPCLSHPAGAEKILHSNTLTITYLL